MALPVDVFKIEQVKLGVLGLFSGGVSWCIAGDVPRGMMAACEPFPARSHRFRLKQSLVIFLIVFWH